MHSPSSSSVCCSHGKPGWRLVWTLRTKTDLCYSPSVITCASKEVWRRDFTHQTASALVPSSSDPERAVGSTRPPTSGPETPPSRSPSPEGGGKKKTFRVRDAHRWRSSVCVCVSLCLPVCRLRSALLPAGQTRSRNPHRSSASRWCDSPPFPLLAAPLSGWQWKCSWSQNMFKYNTVRSVTSQVCVWVTCQVYVWVTCQVCACYLSGVCARGSLHLSGTRALGAAADTSGLSEQVWSGMIPGKTSADWSDFWPPGTVWRLRLFWLCHRWSGLKVKWSAA